jgi:hypothetical protein
LMLHCFHIHTNSIWYTMLLKSLALKTVHDVISATT